MKPQISTEFKFPANKQELPLGPSSQAGIVIEGNAGWRVKRPIVDHEKCIRCHICWVFCPEGVIDRDIAIDMNFCKGCGICAHECPKNAITMISEVEANVK